MKIVAITGSIGCGKTTIAKLIRGMGFTVYDIDGWVRRIYFKKDFIEVIKNHFPSVVENGKVNKRALRNIVFNDNNKLKKLESLIHPFLKQTLLRIIKRNSKVDDLFFLDVALLFEMGWDKYCNVVMVADVDYEIQKRRVMERDHITAEDFEKINQVQMSNQAKIMLADVVVNTDISQNMLKVQLMSIIDELR